MQERQFPSPGQEDPLEEEMATYSSVLVGKSHGQESSSSGRHKEADMTERLSMRIVRHLFDFCFQSNKPIL